jgi:hypothetical protein
MVKTSIRNSSLIYNVSKLRDLDLNKDKKGVTFNCQMD